MCHHLFKVSQPRRNSCLLYRLSPGPLPFSSQRQHLLSSWLVAFLPVQICDTVPIGEHPERKHTIIFYLGKVYISGGGVL